MSKNDCDTPHGATHAGRASVQPVAHPLQNLYALLAMSGTGLGLLGMVLLLGIGNADPESEWGLLGVYLGLTTVVTVLPLGLMAWVCHRWIASIAYAWPVAGRVSVGAIVAAMSLCINVGIPHVVLSLIR